MKTKKYFAIANLLVTGAIAYFVTEFMARGAIAENYTDEVYVAPSFFAILIVWFLGAALLTLYFFLKSIRHSLLIFVTLNILLWASIPLGFFVAVRNLS
ncbi:hypothetical protein CEY16_13235 [Halalkalibacillus sediminis]|uniref:Uncharacterized protein n=1 Tax=Halalkalibacillus sediminis TaxID=2018042 RepID=A0A2I0QR25_9BACI|nr:hypothetical protein [Halalkalibacillus sediminis]PKR76778.1 hypothetical protein CEY16_13235 [Halalkalibacillus sediminis]